MISHHLLFVRLSKGFLLEAAFQHCIPNIVSGGTVSNMQIWVFMCLSTAYLHFCCYFVPYWC